MNSHLSFAELIELEQRLAADRDQPRRLLLERDMRIGQVIAAEELSGPALWRAWLQQRRTKEQHRSLAELITLVERLMVTIFVLVGLVGGFSTAWVWLTFNPQLPVNLLPLWSALVGLPFALFVLWALAMIPRKPSRLALLRDLTSILQGIAVAIPGAVAWLMVRLSGLRRHSKAPSGLILRLKDHAGLMMWRLTCAMQLFVGSYGVGVFIGSVVAYFLSDPSLGWKSAGLGASQMQAVSKVLSMPWSWTGLGTSPELLVIEKTQFTELDPRFVQGAAAAQDPRSIWSRWMPFFLCSVVVYTILPRLLSFFVAKWRAKASLHDVNWERPELRALALRLQRPRVKTQGNAQAVDSFPAALAAKPDSEGIAGDEVTLLCWNDLLTSQTNLTKVIAEHLGGYPARIFSVGGLDTSLDQMALAALQDTPSDVVLAISQWEIPVGDHRDFLRGLRTAIGSQHHVVIMLVADDAAKDRSKAVQKQKLWEQALAPLYDHHLSIELVVPGGGSL